MKQITIFIMEHSSVIRKILFAEFSKHEDLVVVGTAKDIREARSKITRFEPDVILLDLEMPHMDVVPFLRNLMKYHPVPVFLMSSRPFENSTAISEAMQCGAVELIAWPEDPFSGEENCSLPIEKIRSAAHAFPLLSNLEEKPVTAKDLNNKFSEVLKRSTHKVIAIGASTGGTEALKSVLIQMPSKSPGIVVVQHMPSRFTAAFASHLNDLCRIQVREARNGDLVLPGVALIAPGGMHMILEREGVRYCVKIENSPPVCHQRPSVDVLFNSVADCARSNAVGVILTGMGRDGAEGMLKMRRAGAHTIVQDETSCVVFGMPREAILMGGAEHVVPLPKIPLTILKMVADDL